jgi:membrane protein CcdC involved in cytochrome C biogenesis
MIALFFGTKVIISRMLEHGSLMNTKYELIPPILVFRYIRDFI